ncbi:MAG: GGDEF domain-containing phosphodiesterase [Gammaproteobacteria bacterium]|nr:GGDEF domain-containing phosphodiesterase [Gammaproteobacteria bacterium]
MNATPIQLPFLQSDGLARAGRRITLAVRQRQDLAVMIVHVQGVERLCASIGHVRAGKLLDDFYTRLCTIARKNDAVERIGDRKFAILLNGMRNQGHVSLAAQKIERLARETGSKYGDQLNLNTTIGIALCPLHGEEAAELMRLAEIASLDGRCRSESVCFFEEQSAQKLFMDWSLEQRLDNALQSGDLQLHYQPKICLRTGKIVGAEALMRWHEPEIGQISPDIFIDLAESTGQIVDLTQFAIQSACRELADWQNLLPNLSVAVNITPSIIQSREIVDVLESATNIWGVSPSALTLEVTENALMEDREASHEILSQIREFGSRISIDDFGTGYSSFAYLKEIPADELKIDRSFVMGMLNDTGDYKIVEHSIAIAKSFGLCVVAEGIESAAMLEELRKLGCDHAQGYFIGEPTRAVDFEAFCQKAQTEGRAKE